jgi:uncharacterized membrane protein YjjP (DUF1212 family)
MSRLGLVISGFVFIAAAIIVLFSGGGWDAALILFAVGAAILYFYSRG